MHKLLSNVSLDDFSNFYLHILINNHSNRCLYVKFVNMPIKVYKESMIKYTRQAYTTY